MNRMEDEYLGQFTINGRKLPGVVQLKGPDSRIEVFADDFIFLPEEKMRAIRGVARSGEKLTICYAIGAPISGTASYHGTTRHSMSLFPHYVAVGPRHFDPDRKVIAEFSFTTSGALDLFYDLGAFGDALDRVKDVRRLMPPWARKNPRKILHSDVFYFVNRGAITSVDVDSVRIETFNAVSYRFPSPRGINVSNQVRISLKFKKPVDLGGALGAAHDFRHFCEIVSQTKHVIQSVALRHKNAKMDESPIRLGISHADVRSGANVDFRDHLVSGGLHKREFETVLTRWMETQAEHRSARRRIAECVEGENNYTIDRMVGAANAFDLLPDSAVGRPTLPASVLRTLSDLAVEARKLPPPYREHVAGNLSRVKASNLRQKITARFRLLPKGLRARFPDIDSVIDHAVRTRNYFVHGSKPKLSVDDTYKFISRFTDTLEFIFVAAELHECGWKYARWLKEANMGRKRMFLLSYDEFLSELKKAEAGTKSSPASSKTKT